MEISYKRNQMESYMVTQGKYVVQPYEERMLKENTINSLLDFHVVQMDGKSELWHDISGKQSLQDYLEQETVSLTLLESLFRHLIMAFEELEKYLIEKRSILFQPETIYIGKQEQMRIYFCYCPMMENVTPPLEMIMACVLEQMDSSNDELIQFCCELYDFILREEMTFYELHERIQKEMEKEEKSKEVALKTENRMTYEADIWEETETDEVWKYRSRGEEWLDKIRQKGQKICALIHSWDREKKTIEKQQDFVIEGLPKKRHTTELLYDERECCQGKLVYQGEKEEEDYLLTKDIFCVGHCREENDACLKSNAVSGCHARIRRWEGEYYIEDLNSTNGTYVNGEVLVYTQRRKLESMDRIVFGDVCYLFL